MTTYIISDTHFNHDTLIWKHWRPKDFEKQLKINLWKIKKRDTLIHLWDICIGKDSEMHKKYIKPLLCRKVLVRWNHDEKGNGWYLNNWWDEVHKMLILTDNLWDTNNNGNWMTRGKVTLLTHQPLIELPEWRYNIHGHLHDRQIRPHSEYHKLYSPEKEDYAPKKLEDFYKVII